MTYISDGDTKSFLEVQRSFLEVQRLLQKCLHGQTQNVNESLNGIIWTRCPKRVYVGRNIVEIGVSSAVINFNDGSLGLLPVFEKLGIDCGHSTHVSLRETDKDRI